MMAWYLWLYYSANSKYEAIQTLSNWKHSTSDFIEMLCTVWGQLQPRSLWPGLRQTRWTCLHFGHNSAFYSSSSLPCTNSTGSHRTAPENLFQTNFLPASDLPLWKVAFYNKKLKHCFLHSATFERKEMQLKPGEIEVCTRFNILADFLSQVTCINWQPTWFPIVSALHCWFMQSKRNLKDVRFLSMC